MGHPSLIGYVTPIVPEKPGLVIPSIGDPWSLNIGESRVQVTESVGNLPERERGSAQRTLHLGAHS